MADITTDLVALYAFSNNGNDTSGSANVHNATLVGATFIDNKVSQPLKAVNFDGINDIGTIVNQADLEFLLSDMSFSFWTKRLNGADEGYLFNCRDGSINSAPGYAIYQNPNGSMFFFLQSTLADRLFGNLGSGTASGVWNHHCLVFDRSALLTYYLNGTPDGTTDISTLVATSITNSVTPQLGSRNTPVAFGATQLDEFRIYKRALAQADVTQLSNEFGITQGFSEVTNVAVADIDSINEVPLANIELINEI